MNRLPFLHLTFFRSGLTRRAAGCALASLAILATVSAALVLPAPRAYAQASATATQQVPALLGGKVEALAANAAGDTLAVAIEGAGVETRK